MSNRLETKSKMKVSNIALILVATVLITYSALSMYLFYKTSCEMSTLTTCIFAVCGCECGIMGWIKTAKEKNNGKNDSQ